MRFALADPPYPGMAHFYKDHPDYAGEVDHKGLIERLVAEYPDGWLLHTGTTTLALVLSHCPPKTRILSWVKPYCTFKPGVPLTYAWEPIILSGGRQKGWAFRCADWFSDNATSRRGIVGAKPEKMLCWLFRCLGALPGDTLDDLFPGSGAVGRAWDKYQRQIPLPLPTERERQLKLG